MSERLFPVLDRIDLIIQTYDSGLARELMGTETTPPPGTAVDVGVNSRIIFEGSFVRRGGPAADGLLFAIDVTEDADIPRIVAWLSEKLDGKDFVEFETRHGLVSLDEDALDEL